MYIYMYIVVNKWQYIKYLIKPIRNYKDKC